MTEPTTPSQTAAAETHKQPNYGAIFWALLVLTIVEIVVANLPFIKPLIVVSLVVLALVKAALVALFYMHLKYEKYIFYIIVFFPLTLGVTLTLMLLWDKAAVR